MRHCLLSKVAYVLYMCERCYVKSNTRNVQPLVTPSAALQLKCRLHPHEGI